MNKCIPGYMSMMKIPTHFFIDSNGVRHDVNADMSAPTFPQLFTVYKNTIEVMDSQGFVTDEYTLHHITEQVAA